MNQSETRQLREKEADRKQRQEGGADHDDQDEAQDIQHGKAGVQRFCDPAHRPALSVPVTLICITLCAFLTSLAVIFSLAFVFSVLALTPFADRLKAGSPLDHALDIFSRGRLIAMLAAVALDPQLSAEQVRFLAGLPLHALAEAVPPGLTAALAFTILCAVQTAVAAVLMVQAIPPRRIYAALLRVADMLPAGMAGRMRRRIVLAEQRFNSITAETDR
jgi:hypothetical protein